MILDSKTGNGRVVDLDTGLTIRHIIRLNISEGYLEAYRTDSCGNVLKNAKGEKLFYAAKGRFQYIPNPPKAVKKVVVGAERCAKCSSPLTLPGDDLCVSCRAIERGQRNKMSIERLTTPFLDTYCQCGKLAVYSVADEVEVSPQLYQRRFFGRGATVGRRYYCERHYQPAKLLDAKGEVIQDLETIRPEW